MSCRFALDDAAYVLGALPPQERTEYEEHLPGCADCSRAVQEVAGLPGLLSKVALPDVVVPVPDPPDSLLPSLLDTVQRRRRRRGIAVAALGVAAAFLAVLALVGGLAGRTATQTPPAAAASQLQPVGTVPIRASARLAPLPWGTAVALSCTYPGGYGAGGQTYSLVAIDHSGAVQHLASWDVAPGGEANVTATSTWTPEQIATLEIRTPSGTPVMRLTT